jgi:hypothetical protein
MIKKRMRPEYPYWSGTDARAAILSKAEYAD